MDDVLNILGLRPLTPEEISGLQEFKMQMETEVIPQLVERDFENRKRVAESRKWFVD